MTRIVLSVLTGALLVFSADSSTPFLESEIIFPLEHWHNHASCIVEAPNGDLLVCWFHGSGERTADDVPRIQRPPDPYSKKLILVIIKWIYLLFNIFIISVYYKYIYLDLLYKDYYFIKE